MLAHSDSQARVHRASAIRRRTTTRALPASTIPASAPAPIPTAFRAMSAWPGGAVAALPFPSTHTRTVSPFRVPAGTGMVAVCGR